MLLKKKNRNLIKSIDDRPCERRSVIIGLENHYKFKRFVFVLRKKNGERGRERIQLIFFSIYLYIHININRLNRQTERIYHFNSYQCKY